MSLRTTYYHIEAHLARPLRFAVAADIHDHPVSEILAAIRRENPDFIVIPGDLTDCLRESEYAMDFLRRAVLIAPVFYSLGNHERLEKEDFAAIRDTGVTLLDNEIARFEDVVIGGLTSGAFYTNQSNLIPTRPPELGFLDRFAAQEGYKLLLCHHPEYYPRFIRGLEIDLTVSGHAHGGQWRFFGRGIFAPGQGLFPKYTSGVHENRLVVSRGLANHTFPPRLFNPPELVTVVLSGG